MQGSSLKEILSRFFPAARKKNPEDFRVTFDRFREVLDSNNRALEIITDMGEKLGGDYLFDIVYLRNAYDELRAKMLNSLDNFDRLTGERYSGLNRAFGRIDGLVRAVLENTPDQAGISIIPLYEITDESPRDLGGKGAHLAELHNRLHLKTPDGFVITTGAYDDFIKTNTTEQIDMGSGSPEAVRNLIMTGEVPSAIENGIRAEVDRIRKEYGRCFLAVRSSAEEEDSRHTFAGQFETVLNIPAETEEVLNAYRKVLSSLFSDTAIAYQKQFGYEIGRMRMAVICMVMVDAVSSGVVYSSGPDGTADTVMISAAWGLGESVVGGRTDPDTFLVSKGEPSGLVSARYGKKETMVVGLDSGGISEVKRPPGDPEPCLSDVQLIELGRIAMRVEKFFGLPQDIEFAVSREGEIHILQSRPVTGGVKNAVLDSDISGLEGRAILMRDRGTVVQNGAGAGRAFILTRMDDLERVPRGAVLIARNDSSLFVKVMPHIAAIITETGTPASHMAALCRELRVPAVVNTGELSRIIQDGKEITLIAENGKSVVYEGILTDAVSRISRNSAELEDLFEYRRKRYVLRYISLLNLVDPLMDDFIPEACRTMHDILRFIHEKAVAELIDNARSAQLKGKRHVIKLDLPIPAGILVMDLGGGIKPGAGQKGIGFEEIASVPFRAIVKGMLYPGVWQNEAVSVKMSDFLSSMVRMPDMDSLSASGSNVAVISGEYVNMSLRFGYHFNMLDCFCGGYARNNHIYFRFAGGATDLTKRSRRIELIAAILSEYGFGIRTKGDLIIARLSNMPSEEMEGVLDQLGRLIAFTRQLDAVLDDDSRVEVYKKKFLDGNYGP